MKRLVITMLAVAVLLFSSVPAAAASDNQMIGINVVLNTDISDAILVDLGTHGNVRDVVYEINAVTLQARAGELAAIQTLSPQILGLIITAYPEIGSLVDTLCPQKWGYFLKPVDPVLLLDRLSGGDLRLRGTGTTGQAYRIESTPSLTEPAWSLLGSCTADGNGRFSFFPVQTTEGAMRFYRAVESDQPTPPAP